jgi:hypothetical protein
VKAFAPALAVANAVLYEGYILFPYTASAAKNRVRWQFGVVAPRELAARGTGEAAEMQTEVLLESRAAETSVDVLVRFLQVEARQVEAWTGDGYEPVAELIVDGTRHLTFDEGVEREVHVAVRPALQPHVEMPFAFGADEREEALVAADGSRCGRVVRRRWPLAGTLAIDATPAACGSQLCVRIENHSALVEGERSSAPRTAFVSTHTLLHASGDRFLSVLDPPAAAVVATAALRNRNTWPVLVAEGPREDEQRAALVLSSPIVLYDFPAIAPQSEGDTCDGLEIDELMMLSVRALSDAERAEAKATDPRARAIVERAERFGAADLQRLHGTLDIPALDCVFVAGVKVAKGAKVRLHPKRRADSWDTFLAEKVATVRAVHQDLEDVMYVAVTVDDDPASDLHDWYGRSFFFYPDEIEPLAPATARG